VDLQEKVAEALRTYLKPDQILLKDEDGVYGYVVSGQFRGMDVLKRQILIHKALRESSAKLTRAELRKVLAIAALTPAEYAAVDHPK
jgi:acid stress-induced BolA-like protein IbaG/YrbA